MTREPWSGTGLLEQIADTALDDDYYVFRGAEPRRSRRSQLVVALLVTTFALFVTTAAIQTRNDRPGTELERRTLAADIKSRQEILDDRRSTAAALRAQVGSLREGGTGLDERPTDLGVLAASRPANGPGIVIAADESDDGGFRGRITDRDLQILVNGLWYAGAEAVAIGDSRIGAMTSIRTAGEAITVNYRSTRPPYTIVAIGDPESLQARLEQNPAGKYWERRTRTGVKFAVTPSTSISVPAAPSERLKLSHATILEEGR